MTTEKSEPVAVPFYRLLCGVCGEPMIAMQAGDGPGAQFVLACPAAEPSHFAFVMSIDVSKTVFLSRRRPSGEA